MTSYDIDVLTLTDTITNNKDDEYDIPLDISDIINICREYNKLGLQIQNQVENILEVGVEESIRTGNVKQQSLPHIKDFLKSICNNAYFGDATYQANDCIKLIQKYEELNRINYLPTASN